MRGERKAEGEGGNSCEMVMVMDAENSRTVCVRVLCACVDEHARPRWESWSHHDLVEQRERRPGRGCRREPLMSEVFLAVSSNVIIVG